MKEKRNNINIYTFFYIYILFLQPICRNHSVRLADVQNAKSSPSKVAGHTRIDNTIHYTASTVTGNMNTVTNQAVVVDYPFKTPCLPPTHTKTSAQNDSAHSYDEGGTFRENSLDVSPYGKHTSTSNNENKETDQGCATGTTPEQETTTLRGIFDLPDLKETSVDGDVEIVDDLGVMKSSSNSFHNSLTSLNTNAISSHNTTIESDTLNITFSDDHIKQLINNPRSSSSSPSRHSQKSAADESFEILPDLGSNIVEKEGANNGLDSEYHRRVLRIENTMDESQTDCTSKKIVLTEKNHYDQHRLKNARRSKSDSKIDLSSLYLTDSFTNQKDTLTLSQENLNDTTLKSESENDKDILQSLPPLNNEQQQQQHSNNNNYQVLAGNFNTTTESINNMADLSTIEDSDPLQSNNKRRAVSVDDSQMTPSQTRKYTINNNNNINGNDILNNNHELRETKYNESKDLYLSSKTDVMRKKPAPNIQRAHSMSDLLDVNRRREKKFNKRKGFSSKLYRSGSISNILDDFYEEKAKAMSHEHWSTVVSHPERWFYCWHPLLGVNNLLSNWQ